ncbi:VOC family protein [Shewanella cyperi]|uniref:VOC family protein n=1 Tax=Shewanella cyperi TaxID=2814292 RepID=A0A974XNY6_9GAMM|nr:VOC family protein [Shewanella cyperi]QSX30713.1 VOC family protein [Shewanella cyperi]
MRMNQITLPATDLAAAVDFYLTLGAIQIVDTPHYARFVCPEGDSSFSLHLVDAQMLQDSGWRIYFESDRLDAWVEELLQAGLAFESLPRDERWLWREARLRDPAGNQVVLFHGGDNRLSPPWRVDIRKNTQA